jgi:hypothetical protein
MSTGNARLGLNNTFQQHLVEVWPMIVPVAPGDVNDLFVRGIIAVVAPIDMKTGAIEMDKTGHQPEVLGSSWL